MKNTLLITCPKCDYVINGRLWRCPSCGGSDNYSLKMARKSHQEFWNMIIAVLNKRIMKIL